MGGNPKGHDPKFKAINCRKLRQHGRNQGHNSVRNKTAQRRGKGHRRKCQGHRWRKERSRSLSKRKLEGWDLEQGSRCKRILKKSQDHYTKLKATVLENPSRS